MRASIQRRSIIITPDRIKAASTLAGSLLLLLPASVHAAPGHVVQTTYDCAIAPANAAACLDARETAEQERAMAAARRKRLSSRAQRECDSVKAAIADNEEVEQRAGAGGLMESLQQDTLSLRKRYRELGC